MALHPGQHVLARACGTFDQDRHVAGGHAPDQVEQFLHDRVFTDHIVKRILFGDHFVQPAGQGQVLERDQAADHLILVVSQGDEFRLDVHDFAVTGCNRSGPDVARPAVGQGGFQTALSFFAFRPQYKATGFAQHLPPVIPGDRFGRVVEKGDVPASVNQEYG